MRYSSILVAITLPLATPAAAELSSGAERDAAASSPVSASKSFGAPPRRSGRTAIIYPSGPADPVDVATAWAEARGKPALGEAEWRPGKAGGAAPERRR